MTITTIKRIQFNPNFYISVENTNVEVSDTPGDGMTIRAVSTQRYPELGTITDSIEMDQEHAIGLRDALNDLYPV